MSINIRKFSDVVCDACGTTHQHEGGSADARQSAALAAWRFPHKIEPSGQPSAKTHDVCSNCYPTFTPATGKLPTPEGRRYPDSFYQRVAVEYTRLVVGGDRGPGTTIADANDVPASTAHRWIKEARSRGFLAAGRSGRAG